MPFALLEGPTPAKDYEFMSLTASDASVHEVVRWAPVQLPSSIMEWKLAPGLASGWMGTFGQKSV